VTGGDRLTRPGSTDHVEVDLGFGAGLTDRGRSHRRNEDALHLEAIEGIGVIAVVCDGVSLSQAPDVAARAAAGTAGATLAAGLRRGGMAPAELAQDAVRAAQRAVADTAHSTGGELGPPSCTLVLGVYVDGEVAVSWVGDSRAYWVSGGVAVQLTSDNSWAWEQIQSGRMTEDETRGHPRSQQITAWLGADAPDLDAQIVTFRPHGTGRLVLCSDGLWGWLPSPDELARLVGSPPLEPDLLAQARRLVALALAAGGHDDITVVLVDVGAGGPGDAPARPNDTNASLRGRAER